MMNNQIQLFKFKDLSIREVEINNQPWFVGKDVATALEYKMPNKAVIDHVDDEDKLNISFSAKKVNSKMELTLGDKAREAIFRELRNNPNDFRTKVLINESGMYSLILGSKLKRAKEFKHWVTSEVLPSIRKHGAYLTNQKSADLLANPRQGIIDLMQQAVNQLKSNKLLIQKLTPKAAYFDIVMQSKSLMPTTAIAKDYGMSATKLNAILHDLHVQYKLGNTWYLYSQYQDLDWAQTATFYKHYGNGSVATIISTKWTQKGRLGIYNLLKKKKHLVPVCERSQITLI